MKKNKLVVETPYGVVTRTTARPYKYVVVSFGRSEAYLRNEHERNIVYLTKLSADYRVKAARGGTLYSWAKPGDTPATCGQTAENFTEWANDLDAKIAKPFTLPADEFIAHGWSQSRKGAETMANTAARYGYLGIKLVEVNA